jgi:hypothetical protein
VCLPSKQGPEFELQYHPSKKFGVEDMDFFVKITEVITEARV